ncbi:hypothetical protein [Rhodococcus sp. IEGM 1379]|uniref:hypothetical protein n=1 Tax=Rhodococcus sp. IEGM 1379 TaxID=3047086 RepID=UPI0024B7C748|nr:hypothetical protein [Rhodococcus sp. IEGM 1379]MDI9914339.1 hypothetical protein [Rhodococcus sp. IEGM 1379]
MTLVAPAFEARFMLGNARSSRFGAAVTNAFWHTEEGNASAVQLAGYCGNPANNASYHDIVRDRIVCHVVDDDYASWSVLNANPSSYNLCFAGSRAAWTEAQWMARADDIRIAVWLTLEVCRRKGTIATEILAEGGGRYRRGSGIADHAYVTKVLGIGNHTDLGAYFPWWFAKQILAEYLAPAPVPTVVLNAIDEEYKRIGGETSWLGLLEEGELDCRTRGGKFSHFDNGAIYWSPETGAKAIPNYLLDTYATHEWEAGPLGFPIGDHTVLTGPDGKPWGDVQGFEGGPLYRKYGEQDGHRVHGLILATWRRAQFENGELGWPTSDEITLENGDIVQHFEHGDVFYSPTGTVALRPTAGPDQHFPISH